MIGYGSVTLQKANVVIQVVAEYAGISARDIRSASRVKGVAQPRQLAYYICAQSTEMRISHIARAFLRHHTTVMHGIQAVATKIEQGDEMTARDVETLCRIVRAKLEGPAAQFPRSETSEEARAW